LTLASTQAANVIRDDDRPDRPSRARLRREAGASPGEPRKVGLLYLLPALALFSIFVILPLVDTVWLSLFEWDGVGPQRWIGLSNYRALLSDPTVRQAFAHAGVLVIFFSVIPVAMGLFVASTLARVTLRTGGTVRAILFLPQVIAAVVIGVAWRWILAEGGPVNAVLQGVGLGSVTRAWLGDFGWALPSIGLIGTWSMLGLCMLLFLGGIQSIPPSLYDAARTDGAGPLRELVLVTIPGLRNELAIAATLTVITALRVFDLIFVTTQGGPGTATVTPSFLLYTRAFQVGQVGFAAALAVVLTTSVFLVAFVISRVAEGRGT
jgi:raffinose/stachyose/melibiose transport system permease protein